MADLYAYPQKTSSWTNPAKNSTITGTGPVFQDLINAANPVYGATSVQLISSDGTTCTMPLSTTCADQDAIVAIVGDGTLRSIIPSNTTGSAQLRGLISIEII